MKGNKGKTSVSLNVIPVESCHFDLAPLSLGMVWQFDINDNLPVYLSSVMDVVQISRCNMD